MSAQNKNIYYTFRALGLSALASFQLLKDSMQSEAMAEDADRYLDEVGQ